jgi:hypothetical protein
MSYCHEKGISHSHYLGGPLEWDRDDRDKNLAYMIERSTRCQMCGTAGWEWEEDRFSYEPMIEVCFGCQQKDLMREEATQPGTTILLVPKEEAAKMRAKPKHGARSRRGIQ